MASDLTLRADGELWVTADGAWMIRRPRDGSGGWLLELAGAATGDDWHLLNVAGCMTLSVRFVDPADAVRALHTALDEQVRPGEIWRHDRTGDEVKVTKVDRFASGPDGTVFVRNLTRGDSYSPGDFRLQHTRISR